MVRSGSPSAGLAAKQDTEEGQQAGRSLRRHAAGGRPYYRAGEEGRHAAQDTVRLSDIAHSVGATVAALALTGAVLLLLCARHSSMRPSAA